MYPVLFTIFGHPVKTYGVFLSLAHLLAIAGLLWKLKREGKSLEPYVDTVFALFLAGVVGARAAYILENPREFASPLEWLYLWRGGLSVFGGLLLALPAYLAVLRWRKLPVWETSDSLIAILPFSLGLIRLGCFGAGCCHGSPTNLPWGVMPEHIPFHLAGESIHPTQIYEAIFLFTLAIFFTRWKSTKAGITSCLFLLAYGLFRLATNSLRGDFNSEGYLLAQATAGALTFLAAMALAWRWKRVT